MWRTKVSRNKYKGMPYCPVYDTYYDSETSIWIESQCPDPECDFCSDRPKLHPAECLCLEEEDQSISSEQS